MIFDASTWTLGAELVEPELCADATPEGLARATGGADAAPSDEALPSFAATLAREHGEEPMTEEPMPSLDEASDAGVLPDPPPAIELARLWSLDPRLPPNPDGARPASPPAGEATPLDARAAAERPASHLTSPTPRAPSRSPGASGTLDPGAVERDGHDSDEFGGEPATAVGQASARTPSLGGAVDRASEPTRLEQVAARLAMLVEALEKTSEASPGPSRRGELELRLDPPELGELLARVHVHRREVHVSIHAQDGEAARALAREAATLKVQLAEQGFELASFDVATGERGHEHQGARDRRDDGVEDAPAGGHAARTWAARGSRSLTAHPQGPRPKRGLVDVLG